ncbi:acyl-CoA Delta(11) desaturase-like [Melanaphis sacchari]|uniref:Acyl-CoA Delta(11) desaturase n=1 Tax=Melanaphis sacchari TaxID=742174 RepID=A0A2H8TMD9_9HEMI|nr:acyl-CoA Delta(11) desaturase-like [Melanaphis sacchari]XP_025199050.1 acyl-CoA Delta(11) desaturase-like [Melanaphis sacchari]
MAPNMTKRPVGAPSVLFNENDTEPSVVDEGNQIAEGETIENNKYKPYRYQRQIVWRNVALFVYLHIAALYGAYLMFASAKIATSIWAILLYQMSGLGITAGAHRLWAHRSYKGKLPLRIILMIFNTIAFENHIYEWARDHRMHHKYSETNADPHNAKRGFFFSHVGWLLCRKHPEIKEKGRGIDMSDLERDPVVVFQMTYYLLLMPVLCFLVPTCVPVFMWGETWSNAWFVATMFRYTFTLNMTWLVNSAAHMWGDRPYDKFINPSENIGVALGALGEGWHNYHHVFPWDYKAAELGNYRANLTTAFIDFFSKIGWAYDLKTVSMDMIRKRVDRTGDGTHNSIWGWEDKELSPEDREEAVIINRSHVG